MGRSAPENDGDVHFSLLALVDLRSFSQDELRLAARCSSNQNLKQDIVIPDIDPSIFNESLGSRKQSYSIYPLAVSLNYDAVLKESARNPKNNSKTVESSSKSKENSAQGNEHSVSGKRKSPEAKEEDRAGSYSSGSQHKLKKIRIEKEVQPQPSDDKENLGTEIIIESSLESNIQQMERNVEVNSSWQPEHVERNVDVNSNRQHKQVPTDPIQAKMIKCLGKMKGTWTSNQQRRKIVEAKGFPKGWTVTVGLRKARRNSNGRNSNGRASLEFYNYKSPDGKELPSFKEASAYLLSKFGTRPIVEWSKNQKFLGAKSIHVSKDKSTYTCSSCRNTFGSKKLLLKHKSKTGHGNNNLIGHGKHMNLGTTHTHVLPIGAKQKSVMGNHITSLSFVDASGQKNVPNRAHDDEKTSPNVSQVSMECGICHKVFTNKRKYWGHLGAHSSSRGKGVVHNGVECEHCHKTFTKKSQYWGHLRKHYKKPFCNALVGKETQVMETISPPNSKQDFVLPKNSQVGIPNVNHLHNTMEDGIFRGTKFEAALEVDMQSSKILAGDIGWCSEGCYICEKKIDVVDASICSWCEKEFHLMCVGKTIKDDEWICPSCAF